MIEPPAPRYARIPYLKPGEIRVSSEPADLENVLSPRDPASRQQSGYRPGERASLIAQDWRLKAYNSLNEVDIAVRPDEEAIPWLLASLRLDTQADAQRSATTTHRQDLAIAALCLRDKDLGLAMMHELGITPATIQWSTKNNLSRGPVGSLDRRYEPYIGVWPATRPPPEYREWLAQKLASDPGNKYLLRRYYAHWVLPGHTDISTFRDWYVDYLLAIDQSSRRTWVLIGDREPDGYGGDVVYIRADHWEEIRVAYIARETDRDASFRVMKPTDPGYAAARTAYLERNLRAGAPDHDRAVASLASQGEAGIPALVQCTTSGAWSAAPLHLSVMLHGQRHPELETWLTTVLSTPAAEQLQLARLAASLASDETRALARRWALAFPKAGDFRDSRTILAISYGLDPFATGNRMLRQPRDQAAIRAEAIKCGPLIELPYAMTWSNQFGILFHLDETGSDTPHDQRITEILQSVNSGFTVENCQQYVVDAAPGSMTEIDFVVSFACNGRAYYASIESKGDWYNGDAVAMIVNRVMQDNDRPERLILVPEFDTAYLLADPAVALPILSQLGMTRETSQDVPTVFQRAAAAQAAELTTP